MTDERRGRRAPTTASSSYPVDYAIAIHVYTLEDPSVYRVVNRAMFNPNRRQGIGGVSAELRACLPYIKFLDAALAALPLKDNVSKFHISVRGCVRKPQAVHCTVIVDLPPQMDHNGVV